VKVLIACGMASANLLNVRSWCIRSMALSMLCHADALVWECYIFVLNAYFTFPGYELAYIQENIISVHNI